MRSLAHAHPHGAGSWHASAAVLRVAVTSRIDGLLSLASRRTGPYPRVRTSRWGCSIHPHRVDVRSRVP